MKKLFFSFLTVVLLFTSCSIEMNMTVNKDYSGSHEMIIDISQMMSFAASMDSLSEGDMDSIMAEISPEDEITDEDRAILAESGITNLSFGMDMENMNISYDFEDINRSYDFFYVLDSSITDEERSRMLEIEMFKVEDDRITIRFEDDGLAKMLKDEMAAGDGEEEEEMDMSFMTMLFTFKQSYTFERPVAKIIDNDLPVRLKDGRVYYSTNLSEYLDEFVGKEIVVIFESEGKKKRK